MRRANPVPAGAVLLLSWAFVAGCAIHPVPTEQLAVSEAAIARAVDAGAATYALVDLNSAQEKLRLSRRWVAARDLQPARWLAEQAEVDANLAMMKTLTAKARAGL